ncbi:Crp/Fnr family transcriptional regulator [Methylotenera sp.]|uniref:Crp/Fnr family transcriptional regulator n=1 Tax=Methylotenera sp. TaxID=2051956 RepID=UPI00345B6F88
MSGENTTDQVFVQNSGFAYRLKAQLLRNEFERSGHVFQILLRYFQARMTHVAQTAVCNRHHTIEQQLCRFLLLSLDRLPSNSIAITQELIASKLGVRRESVTEAVGNLQRTGLIKCSRGHIEVLARSGLEKTSCECYSVVKQEFDRLLTNIPASTLQPN